MSDKAKGNTLEAQLVKAVGESTLLRTIDTDGDKTLSREEMANAVVAQTRTNPTLSTERLVELTKQAVQRVQGLLRGNSRELETQQRAEGGRQAENEAAKGDGGTVQKNVADAVLAAAKEGGVPPEGLEELRKRLYPSNAPSQASSYVTNPNIAAIIAIREEMAKYKLEDTFTKDPLSQAEITAARRRFNAKGSEPQR
jgi:hypothetical protein